MLPQLTKTSLCCWICGTAVNLKTCVSDEHGMPVHEACYLAKIALTSEPMSTSKLLPQAVSLLPDLVDGHVTTSEMSATKGLLPHAGPRKHMCSVCNQPVNLETAKINEDGHAVHDACYFATISSKVALKPVQEIAAAFNPYTSFAGSPQLPELLMAMIFVTGADFGNVQLLDSSRAGLRIVVQHGFGVEFLDYFETVCSGSSSCGAAMNERCRVVVSDIVTDPLFQDAGTRAVMLRAKVRACQSTPLFDQFGHFIGVVSTHFRQPTSFDVSLWERVDKVIGEFTKNLSASA